MTDTKFHIYFGVPARLESTRLPRKLLRTIGSQSVIEHVCDRLLELTAAYQNLAENSVCKSFVVTDSEEIAAQIAHKKVSVFRSRHSHANGTSRLCEALMHDLRLESLCQTELSSHYLVNLQGDEPFVNVHDILRLIDMAKKRRDDFPVTTLAFRESSMRAFLDPSHVKVTFASDNRALYFSRAPIPWPRDLMQSADFDLMNRVLSGSDVGEKYAHSSLTLPGGDEWFFWQHMGIYAYRIDFLLQYTRARVLGSPYEQQEGLEQLGFLEAGAQVGVCEAAHASIGIDTESDLERAEEICKARGL